MLDSGPCGDPQCYVLHADPANPIHPPFYEDSRDSEMDLGLPYKPHSRQVQGRITERKVLRSMGARQHPNSGAGRIKEDGSTEDSLIEVKDANRTFTLHGADLEKTFVRATRQGKEGVWVISFANGMVATISLNRKAR